MKAVFFTIVSSPPIETTFTSDQISIVEGIGVAVEPRIILEYDEEEFEGPYVDGDKTVADPGLLMENGRDGILFFAGDSPGSGVLTLYGALERRTSTNHFDIPFEVLPQP